MRRNIRDGFWGIEDLPVARVAKSDDGDDYDALLGREFQEQRFGVREFLKAAFSKRLHYRVPRGCLGTASVWVGPIACWRCKRDTNIVTSVQIDLLGSEPSVLRISDFEGHPDALRWVVEHTPKELRVGAIKPRYSKTEGGAYLSNGCGYCGSLIGRFFNMTPGIWIVRWLDSTFVQTNPGCRFSKERRIRRRFSDGPDGRYTGLTRKMAYREHLPYEREDRVAAAGAKPAGDGFL